MVARRLSRFAAVAALLGVGGLAAWHGGAWIGADAQTTPTPSPSTSPSAEPSDAAATPPETVADEAAAGDTPMARRVAVVGLLNKRNGVSRDLTLRPGQAVRVGEVVVRLRACDQTAPWEPDQLTGAFVQLDVEQVDKSWRRAFSGWLFKERPALNVVQHPVYDVWTKSCTMSFPASGPETVPAASVVPTRSSAKKSPGTDAAPAAEAPTTPDSAAVSNAT